MLVSNAWINSEDCKGQYTIETRILPLGTDGQTVEKKSHGTLLLYMIIAMRLLRAQEWKDLALQVTSK